ncbi:uncharacterized protein LOC128765277 [Synchiropus splendidus]|uniref:uncharacterized protein LOC128765277 n=1 Tax=Synchiropus splendidus TaxID=270530 RepID=UPI00237E0159|nr:uncharacterized protein LOC128765277 [Synchiropus splendidus]
MQVGRTRLSPEDSSVASQPLAPEDSSVASQLSPPPEDPSVASQPPLPPEDPSLPSKSLQPSSSSHSNEPPPPLVSDDRPSTSLQSILKVRWHGRGYQYLVRWEGYGTKERSWISGSLLDHRLFSDFHSLNSSRPGKTPGGYCHDAALILSFESCFVFSLCFFLWHTAGANQANHVLTRDTGVIIPPLR